MAFQAFNFGKQLGIVGNETTSEQSPPIRGRLQVIRDPCGPNERSILREIRTVPDPASSDNPLDPNTLTYALFGCDPTYGGIGGNGLSGIGIEVAPGGGGGVSTRQRDEHDPPENAPYWALRLWTDPKRLRIFTDAVLPPDEKEKQALIKALKSIVLFDCLRGALPKLAACLQAFLMGDGFKIAVFDKSVDVNDRDNTRPRGGAICPPDGVTRHGQKVIFLCASLFALGNERRLRSVLIHELMHACYGSGPDDDELYIEALEQYCDPQGSEFNEYYRDRMIPIFIGDAPDWNQLKGCKDVRGFIAFASDDIIWDPKGGQVWINEGTKDNPKYGKQLFFRTDKYNPFKLTGDKLKEYDPVNLEEMIPKMKWCIPPSAESADNAPNKIIVKRQSNQ